MATGEYGTIRGTEGRQHGRRMICGFIAAKDLAAMYENGALKVDVYAAANSDGYQRSLSKTRSRKFGRYIQDSERGISPTSVLLYARGPDAGIEKIESGKWRVPLDGGGKALFIADGQHRTDGISEALKEGWLTIDSEFDIPMTLLFWDPKQSPSDPRLEEAMQFYTINTQQKRMRTDLAHRYIYRQREEQYGPIGRGTLLTRMRKRDFVPYEIYVTDQMRLNENSPWQEMILPPNAAGDAPITEGSFTDSLHPVIDYAITANMTVGDVIDLLGDYWNAIFELCANARSNHSDYVLMKTAGVYSLHLFLPTLLIRRPNLGKKPSIEQLKKVLVAIGDVFQDEFWESSSGEAATFGTGKKSFQELSDHIASELP